VSRSCAFAFAVVICLGVFMASPVAGQATDLEHQLDAAKELYREGQIDQAIVALRQVIAQLNKLQDQLGRHSQLAEAHLHLALSYVALRDESGALENFRQVAALDPQRRLDPDVYSPRVIGLFDRARADIPSARAAIVPADEAASGRPAAPEPVSKTLGLPLGTKLRVTLGDDTRRVVGTLLKVDEAGLTVLGAANTSIVIPSRQLTRLEVVQRRKSHWLMGLLIGATTGAVIGALETPGCAGNDGDCYTRGENIGYGALGAGIVGGLVGALYKTDEWTDVPVSSVASNRPRLVSRRITLAFSWR